MRHSLIKEIYATGKVQCTDGRSIDLRSSISPEEGLFIHELIAKDATIRKTLEVGCAFGLSSLHICSAIAGRDGAHHTIIDYCQTKPGAPWQGVGIANLSRAGFDFFELIEEGSEFALPELAKKNPERFDFIFIDGWHTFDHTLIDCFYATRLLRIGGYLVVDDANLPQVEKVIRYIRTYPCYIPCGKLHQRRSRFWNRRPAATMIALRKIAPDRRPWNWYRGI
jgi:predicted O-methyltransferase YrrM